MRLLCRFDQLQVSATYNLFCRVTVISWIPEAIIEMVEGLGPPTKAMRNRRLLTSEWTAKVFPGHFDFYRFYSL